MSTYQQLTQAQRYQIYALKKAGHQQTELANTIGKHKTIIKRELKRIRGQRSHRPKQAQRLAQRRRRKGRCRIYAESRALIQTKICPDWSPEQISGWLLKKHYIQVSHEWLYQ